LLRLTQHRADRAPRDYIAGWLDLLREENRTTISPASQATKAADNILTFLPADDSRAPAATIADVTKAIGPQLRGPI
jgi:antirestriction protein ArdC